jgi:hypothetical protein
MYDDEDNDGRFPDEPRAKGAGQPLSRLFEQHSVS